MSEAAINRLAKKLRTLADEIESGQVDRVHYTINNDIQEGPHDWVWGQTCGIRTMFDTGFRTLTIRYFEPRYGKRLP